MPGTYNHWPTVQADRNGEFVYNSTGSNWVVVDSAIDFTIDMDDYYFMLGETKDIELRIKNEGTEAASGITFTMQINSRFTYVTGSMKGGTGDVAPETERFEGGGLFVKFPNTFTIPAGETVTFRFQATAN